MERLTIRKGDKVYSAKLCAYVPLGDAEKVIGEGFKKLAAYEDTGRSPDEIAAMEKDIEMLEGADIALDYYRHLEAEGRLVEVIRCKDCIHAKPKMHRGEPMSDCYTCILLKPNTALFDIDFCRYGKPRGSRAEAESALGEKK